MHLGGCSTQAHERVVVRLEQVPAKRSGNARYDEVNAHALARPGGGSGG